MSISDSVPVSAISSMYMYSWEMESDPPLRSSLQELMTYRGIPWEVELTVLENEHKNPVKAWDLKYPLPVPSTFPRDCIPPSLTNTPAYPLDSMSKGCPSLCMLVAL